MTNSNDDPNSQNRWQSVGVPIVAIVLVLLSFAVMFGVVFASFYYLPSPWGWLGSIPAIIIYSYITGNTLAETIIYLFILFILGLIAKCAIDAIKDADPQNENAIPPNAVAVPEM